MAKRYWRQITIALVPLLVLGWVAIVNRFPEGFTFSAGDFTQPTNIQKIFGDFFYVWGSRIAAPAEGGYFSWFSATPFYFFLYFLPSKLGLTDTQVLSCVLLIILFIYYLMSLLALLLLFGKKHFLLSSVFSLIYALNPTTLYFFTYAWGPSHQVFLYPFIPILTVLLLKILGRAGVFYIPLFLIFVFISLPSYTNAAFAAALSFYLFVVVILGLSLRLIILGKQQLWFLFILFFGTISVLGLWSLPTLFFAKGGLAAASASTVFDLRSWLGMQSASVLSVFSGVQGYSDYFPFKYDSGPLSAAVFVPVFLFAFALLKGNYKKKEHRLVVLFSLVYLLVVILVKKLAPPFSGVSLWLFSKTPLFVLRSYEKTAIFLPFALLLPSYIFIKNIPSKQSKIILILFVFLVGLSAKPFFTGGIQTKYSVTFPKGKNYLTADYSILVSMPSDYRELSAISDNDKRDSRIQALPFSPLNSITWINYPKWKAIGSDPVEMLFNKSTLFSNSSIYVTQGWTPSEYFNSSTRNPLWYLRLLSLFDTSDILYHKDVAEQFIPLSLPKIERLAADGYINELKETENANLYSVSKDQFLPHFYIPEDKLFVAGGVKSLPAVLGFSDYKTRSAVCFSQENTGAVSDCPWGGPKESSDLFVIPKKVVVESALGGSSSQESGANSIVMPETNILPNSPFYFYVEWKEKRDLAKEKTPLSRADLLLWFSSKRIVELKKQLENGDSEASLKTLNRYIAQLKDVVLSLGDLTRTTPESFSLVDKARGYFAEHRQVLESLRKTLPPESGVKNAITDIYSLYDSVDSLAPRENRDLYFFNVAESGKYQLYIGDAVGLQDTFEDNFQEKGSTIAIDRGTELNIRPESVIDGWYKYPNLSLSAGVHNLSLTKFKPINLVSDGSFEERSFPIDGDFLSYFSEAATGSASLRISTNGDQRREVAFNVNNFKPEYKYQISFYYKSLMGEGVQFAVWHDVPVGIASDGTPTNYTSKVVLDKSPYWKRLNFTWSPVGNAKAMKLVFFLPAQGEQVSMLLDGVWVESVFEPDLVFRKVEMPKEVSKVMPKILFTKINPTKYLVRVSGVVDPYTLVFSESFNKGWKVYVNNNQGSEVSDKNRYGDTLASYFGGDIAEGTHRNTFFDSSTLETWQMSALAESKHFNINGYANAWHIVPADSGGKPDYELIVEFWPQRLFYIGIVVSTVSVSACVLWLIVLLIRRRKK